MFVAAQSELGEFLVAVRRITAELAPIPFSETRVVARRVSARKVMPAPHRSMAIPDAALVPEGQLRRQGYAKRNRGGVEKTT